MDKPGGLWQAVRAYLDGRNAVTLERERRTTLLTVPPALPPGAEIHDVRADGSALRMWVPPVLGSGTALLVPGEHPAIEE